MYNGGNFMKNKFKTMILLACTVLILAFALIGCSNNDANTSTTQSSTTVSDNSSENTSNYTQEFEIDENDGNATSPQANDSIDLG